jgi:hypothetical protein
LGGGHQRGCDGGHQSGCQRKDRLSKDPPSDEVDDGHQSDAAEEDHHSANQQKRAMVGQELTGKVFDGGEVPDHVPGHEVETVGQQQHVHQQRRLVEPVGIEITGPQRHGALHEVKLVAEVREGKIVKETTESEQGGDEENDPEMTWGRGFRRLGHGAEICLNENG